MPTSTGTLGFTHDAGAGIGLFFIYNPQFGIGVPVPVSSKAQAREFLDEIDEAAENRITFAAVREAVEQSFLPEESGKEENIGQELARTVRIMQDALLRTLNLVAVNPGCTKPN